MRIFLGYLKNYKKEAILAPLFKMLEATFELLVPLVVAVIVDKGIAGGDRGLVIRMSLLLLGLGIIGLVSPVIVLAHSIFAAGIQNAITRFVAASKKEKTAEAYGFLFTGIAISIFLSGITTYVVFSQAPFIASNIIGERRCTPLLRISTLSFPLATIHSCLNGFFYGQKRASIPAVSIIIEQIVRVLTVYFLYKITVRFGANVSLSYICLGMFAGEFCSAIFSPYFILL